MVVSIRRDWLNAWMLELKAERVNGFPCQNGKGFLCDELFHYTFSANEIW